MESGTLFDIGAVTDGPGLDSWNPFPFVSNKIPEPGVISWGRCSGS